MAIGAPDWYRTSKVSVSTLMSGIGRWYYTFSFDVDPETTGIATLWTVPDGERLYLTLLNVSCDASIVQYVALLRDSYIFAQTYFDSQGHIQFYFPANAGETIKIALTNFDSVTRNFVGGLYGYTEKI